jgi:hypothetical protein
LPPQSAADAVAVIAVLSETTITADAAKAISFFLFIFILTLGVKEFLGPFQVP